MYNLNLALKNIYTIKNTKIIVILIKNIIRSMLMMLSYCRTLYKIRLPIFNNLNSFKSLYDPLTRFVSTIVILKRFKNLQNEL